MTKFDKISLRQVSVMAKAEEKNLGAPLPDSYDVSHEKIEGGIVVMCDDRIIGVAEHDEQEDCYSIVWPNRKALGKWPLPNANIHMMYMYLLGYWEGIEGEDAVEEVRQKKDLPPSSGPIAIEPPKVEVQKGRITPSKLLVIPFV